ncbi:MAG: 4Fe-4S binding protein [Candidatus Symbiothrix sp.]|nr:4Fe-4S binding protein [Candidatus Symbiothrix sp.]
MKRKMIAIGAWCLAALPAFAQNRFPKPDFESGYQYPTFDYPVPNELLWTSIDIFVLTAMMIFVSWAIVKRRNHTPAFIVSIISVLYFGFYRKGCVCSIGAIQNVVLSLTDSPYAMPISVFLVFILPIIFALLIGRVFCAGVCPFGALQDLVNIKNYRLPKSLSAVLSILPWIYLILAILFALTRSRFIICRFDPFIGIFRMGGDMTMIAVGVVLLIISVFFGRPFCRFICPYGALLSLFSRVAIHRIRITPSCNNCDLCHNACPVDAIRPPYENKVKERRKEGVKRLLAYFVFLPIMALAGALLLRISSDTLSQVNKDIRLYEKVLDYENRHVASMDMEIFLSQGGQIDELKTRASSIRAEFKIGATVAGACIGFIIAATLIGLSIKRTRKTYEIDTAACIACGRCFNYCPQNITHKNIQQHG